MGNPKPPLAQTDEARHLVVENRPILQAHDVVHLCCVTQLKNMDLRPISFSLFSLVLICLSWFDSLLLFYFVFPFVHQSTRYLLTYLIFQEIHRKQQKRKVRYKLDRCRILHFGMNQLMFVFICSCICVQVKLCVLNIDCICQ